MKKRLLFAALAMVCSLSSFALNTGDYVYAADGRYKLTGSNLITNGDFSEGTDGWTVDDPTTFVLTDGIGPNGESGIQSAGATADVAITRVWDAETLEGGQLYVLSFDIRNTDGSGSTSITAGQNNYIDFFMNTDGSTTYVAPTDDAPVIRVATTASFDTDWKTVAFAFTAEQDMMLAAHIEKLVTGTQITNFSLCKAMKVYDIRLAEAKVKYITDLLAVEEFNVPEASTARNALERFLTNIQNWMTDGTFDDASVAETRMNAANTAIDNYLDVTTMVVNSLLAGTSNLPSLATVGRGGNFPATYANLQLYGGNWGHVGEADYLMSAIQNGYANSATYNVFHQDFPAGKYFFTAEIRNANTGKESWPCVPTFNLETMCKIFVANDTTEIGPVAGEEYQKFFKVGEVAEDGAFRAGIEWPGTSRGGAFFIKNVEVRAFNTNILTDVEHVQAWKTYATQWNAAVSAHKQVKSLEIDGNYPWGKDSLKSAREIWDPYFYGQANKGWMKEDGTDAGTATTEELLEWADWQGADPAAGYKFQVGRGYQNAANYVKNLNKPLTDLADAIVAAKATRNKATNISGDRETYKTAILAALNTLNTTRANTTDDTRVADSTTVADAQKTLETATEAFLASVALKPFVDIDFSQAAVLDEETGTYSISGTLGSIVFSNYDPDRGTTTEGGNTNFCLGYGDAADIQCAEVLRVGNGTATVTLTEEQQIADDETFRATFDFWFGNLTSKNAYVDLRNAMGERVAGFSLNRYNGTVAYNEFNNEDNEGMDILAYATGVGSSSASNVAICADNNRTSFDLTVNYATGKLQGTITNPQKGEKVGIELPIREISDDMGGTKITSFVVGSNYIYADRLCWFDNLKLYKFKQAGSDLEEDITEDPWLPVADGIQTATVAKKYTNAIYTISGQRVNGAPSKGLYIINGKKYVVK